MVHVVACLDVDSPPHPIDHNRLVAEECPGWQSCPQTPRRRSPTTATPTLCQSAAVAVSQSVLCLSTLMRSEMTVVRLFEVSVSQLPAKKILESALPVLYSTTFFWLVLTEVPIQV